MKAVRKKPRVQQAGRSSVYGGGGDGFRAHGYRCSFYAVPPIGEVSLAEFDGAARARVEVLKAIDSAKLQGKVGDDLDKAIGKAVRSHLPLSLTENAETQDERRRDVLSHWICRLAYARNEPLRRWFLTQEKALFLWRCQQESQEGLAAFMHDYNLRYDAVTSVERKKLEPLLDTLVNAGEPPTSYFKVRFEDAIELVGQRRVLLRDGFAFVPQDRLVVILAAQFRERLAAALSIVTRTFSKWRGDERVDSILTAVSRAHQASDYVGRNHGNVKPEDIDGLARAHFPMCMRNMHEGLRSSHHLRHTGRMQYGLFLKAIGLTMDDAVSFWRSELAQSHVGADKFDKAYAYNIRHNYGQEGKRLDYSAYSCMKIIMGGAPTAGERHGCPFAHHDSSSLGVSLRAAGLTHPQANEIVAMTEKKQYQIACRRHFELMHPGFEQQAADAVGNHPNAWFDTSVLWKKAKESGFLAQQLQQQQQRQQPQQSGVADGSETTDATGEQMPDATAADQPGTATAAEAMDAAA